MASSEKPSSEQQLQPRRVLENLVYVELCAGSIRGTQVLRRHYSPPLCPQLSHCSLLSMELSFQLFIHHFFLKCSYFHVLGYVINPLRNREFQWVQGSQSTGPLHCLLPPSKESDRSGCGQWVSVCMTAVARGKHYPFGVWVCH